MRGTHALLVHMVNDYLIKELPQVRDMLIKHDDEEEVANTLQFAWEYDKNFLNYTNAKILEYEDDNEYFNIDPVEDVKFTERTNARYWEQLYQMDDDDTLGVLTKGQIKNFYQNVLGIGRLQPQKPKDYDDVMDFLVDLFKIGANPIKYNKQGELDNPIDDKDINAFENYGYSKQQRLEVQQNTQLRENQERQFKEYSGNIDIKGNMYDFVNNKIFYWKNVDYSSHMLHPFMYNLKLWNRLNNIIINGYRDYVDNDLIEYLSSKVKFDDIFGKFGESRRFWKYNILDLSGYTTRYEAAIKDEHLGDNSNNTISELTGYDGLFYPDAAKDFLDLHDMEGQSFALPNGFFNEERKKPMRFKAGQQEFVAAIYSIYWQDDSTWFSDENNPKPSFYYRWYSHLDKTKKEFQKMAMQLWYWRDRIKETITTRYPISKYCLDTQGNSLILVQPFNESDKESNPYLIDLAIAQNEVVQNRSGNKNTHVSFCENSPMIPAELWIRWKSSPIAIPAFDLNYDKLT